MMSQTQTQQTDWKQLETFCQNITATDPTDQDRVFCKLRQEWVQLSNCGCGPNLRTREVSMEW